MGSCPRVNTSCQPPEICEDSPRTNHNNAVWGGIEFKGVVKCMVARVPGSYDIEQPITDYFYSKIWPFNKTMWAVSFIHSTWLESFRWNIQLLV